MSNSKKKHVGLTDGKVALVTGAGAGIGRATALLFASEGAKVVVTNRSEQNGLDTLKMIKDAGGEAVYTPMDISKEDSIEAAIKFAVDTYGRLDCAVNNAGMEQERTAPLNDINNEEWEKLVSVDLQGCFWCLKHEANTMLKNGGGAIVNIASIAGIVIAGPGYGVYGTAKAAVIHLSKSAAMDYAKTKSGTIRVNCIAPGTIMTRMLKRVIDESPDYINNLNAATPMRRVGEPSEIANACVWLCSDRASYITGQTLAVDGGTTIS